VDIMLFTILSLTGFFRNGSGVYGVCRGIFHCTEHFGFVREPNLQRRRGLSAEETVD